MARESPLEGYAGFKCYYLWSGWRLGNGSRNTATGHRVEVQRGTLLSSSRDLWTDQDQWQ